MCRVPISLAQASGNVEIRDGKFKGAADLGSEESFFKRKARVNSGLNDKEGIDC